MHYPDCDSQSYFFNDGFPNIPWTNGALDLIGGTDSEIGSGKSNTDLIIDALGSGENYAASHARAYVNIDYGVGVFNDWYLPSINELMAMKNAFLDVATKNESLLKENEYSWHDWENFLNACFKNKTNIWSSTEHDESHAFTMNIRQGVDVEPVALHKSMVVIMAIIPIRAF